MSIIPLYWLIFIFAVLHWFRGAIRLIAVAVLSIGLVIAVGNAITTAIVHHVCRG